MIKQVIPVITRSAAEHISYLEFCLGDQYEIIAYSSCADVPLKVVEKPLFYPAQSIIFFTDDWQQDEINLDVTHLTPKETNINLYSVLFVADGHMLDKVANVMRENDDFIQSSFTPEILQFKLSQVTQRSTVIKKLSRDLHEASEIALLSMSNSSELGEVSRFILASYSCMNYEELLDALSNTIVVFGVSCSALIVVDDSVVVRLASDAQPNTRKIMLKYHNQGRIHHIHRETIITFAHASIMLHNMPLENDHHYGRLLDNLTVLGNCFEARVKGIHAEQEASAASKAKTMFLATMSHELRTPMNSVIGFTERLIAKLEGRLNEREQKHLFAIKRNGDHLLSLINDILDVSKIEVGKMEIHPDQIDVIEQVNNIYLQLQPIAQNKDLDFSFSSDQSHLVINADLKRFTQMVMNLVSNAIKYTAEGAVNISVANDLEDNNVRIDVVDTGIGISEDDQKRLFSNFVQIDSELSRKVEGTGLGLAISIVFADMHGGKIDVHSKQGEGSCFSLILPTPANANSPIIEELNIDEQSSENESQNIIHTIKPDDDSHGITLF